MKKLIYLLLTIIVCFVSCSDDDSESKLKNNQILGAWVRTGEMIILTDNYYQKHYYKNLTYRDWELEDSVLFSIRNWKIKYNDEYGTTYYYNILHNNTVILFSSVEGFVSRDWNRAELPNNKYINYPFKGKVGIVEGVSTGIEIDEIDTDSVNTNKLSLENVSVILNNHKEYPEPTFWSLGLISECQMGSNILSFGYNCPDYYPYTEKYRKYFYNNITNINTIDIQGTTFILNEYEDKFTCIQTGNREILLTFDNLELKNMESLATKYKIRGQIKITFDFDVNQEME